MRSLPSKPRQADTGRCAGTVSAPDIDAAHSHGTGKLSDMASTPYGDEIQVYINDELIVDVNLNFITVWCACHVGEFTSSVAVCGVDVGCGNGTGTTPCIGLAGLAWQSPHLTRYDCR